MAILRPENIEKIVVHCSASPPSRLIGAKEIDVMHKNRGWSGIGYHLVIRRNLSYLGGLIELGRSLNIIGAHVQGYNDISLGICMVGGVDKFNKPENNFTEDQFKALFKTVKFLKGIFPKAEVLGHNSFPNVNKACPCFNVRKWWQLRSSTPSQPIVQSSLELGNLFEW